MKLITFLLLAFFAPPHEAIASEIPSDSFLNKVTRQLFSNAVMGDGVQVSVSYEDAVALAKAYAGQAIQYLSATAGCAATMAQEAKLGFIAQDVIDEVNQKGENTQGHVRRERYNDGLRVIEGDRDLKGFWDRELSSSLSTGTSSKGKYKSGKGLFKSRKEALKKITTGVPPKF